jgi:hypothetical protein
LTAKKGVGIASAELRGELEKKNIGKPYLST